MENQPLNIKNIEQPEVVCENVSVYNNSANNRYIHVEENMFHYGLRPIEILIYSYINGLTSWSVDQRGNYVAGGAYIGSQRNLADFLQVSVGAVNSAINTLLKNAMIEKFSFVNNGHTRTALRSCAMFVHSSKSNRITLRNSKKERSEYERSKSECSEYEQKRSEYEQKCSEYEQSTPVSLYKYNKNNNTKRKQNNRNSSLSSDESACSPDGSQVAPDGATRMLFLENLSVDKKKDFPVVNKKDTAVPEATPVGVFDEDTTFINVKKQPVDQKKVWALARELLDLMGLPNVKVGVILKKTIQARLDDGHSELDLKEIAKWARTGADKYLYNPMVLFGERGITQAQSEMALKKRMTGTRTI